MATVTFPPVVRVVWTAPVAPPPDGEEWIAVAGLEAATKSRVCDAVGFLVLDTPTRIGIAAALDPSSGLARGVVVIPRSAIADDIVTLKQTETVED